jgi:hypothetical protein
MGCLFVKKAAGLEWNFGLLAFRQKPAEKAKMASIPNMILVFRPLRKNGCLKQKRHLYQAPSNKFP